MAESFSLHPQLQKDCIFIQDLPLCRLLFMNDENYPWVILVPRLPQAKELIDIPDSLHPQFWEEMRRVSVAMQKIFTPDKLNVAALGNMVPQLHIHVIARFKSDLAWPKPVWGTVAAKSYTEAKSAELITKISAEIKV